MLPPMAPPMPQAIPPIGGQLSGRAPGPLGRPRTFSCNRSDRGCPSTATRESLFQLHARKFRIRGPVRPQTVGRKHAGDSPAPPSRGRARGGHVSDRRRRAVGRGCEAGASFWRQPSFLDLRAVFEPAVAPFRRQWVALVPRLRKAVLSLAARPGRGGSRDEVAAPAWRRARATRAPAAQASTLEPRLLSAAHRRAYCSRGRDPRDAWWYDPRARTAERSTP